MSSDSSGPTQQHMTVDAKEDENKSQFNQRTLELEEIGPDTYMSVDLWRPMGNRGVFGGQVIGQAMSAAAKTVENPFRCNSFHGYFLAAGNGEEMIAYEVRRTRQGRSFCSRLVLAKQGGRAIFIATASFQVPEKSSLDHQYAMPAVPPPESLLSREEYIRRKQQRTNKRVVSVQQLDERDSLPVEGRIVPLKKNALGLPVKMMWLRAKGDMSELDLTHHQAMLAYATDFGLISTASKPHINNPTSPRPSMGMVVSLDHTIWFHESFRADDWLLYVMESPRAASGRGFAVGRIYRRDGVMVASVAQEGVVRASDTDKEYEPFEFSNKIDYVAPGTSIRAKSKL
ncbi:acyl-CoA thioesterase [Linderina pennispora]|nr:acyl-CoA thioesterase [Linderina pennispora]